MFSANVPPGLCLEKLAVSEKSFVPSKSLAVDSGTKLRAFLLPFCNFIEDEVPKEAFFHET